MYVVWLDLRLLPIVLELTGMMLKENTASTVFDGGGNVGSTGVTGVLL